MKVLSTKTNAAKQVNNTHGSAIKYAHYLLEAIHDKCNDFTQGAVNVISYRYTLGALYYDLALTCYEYNYQTTQVNKTLNGHLNLVIECLEKLLKLFKEYPGHDAKYLKRIEHLDLVVQAKNMLGIVKGKDANIKLRISTLEQAIKEVYANKQNDTKSLLCNVYELIECHLELGEYQQVQHYIDQLASSIDHTVQLRLAQFQERLDCLKMTREIFNLELKLIIPQQDDLQSLIIHSPRDEQAYKTQYQEWSSQMAKLKPQENHALFIKNPSKDNSWEAWFFIAYKEYQLTVTADSFLARFLEHYQGNSSITGFAAEVLELIGQMQCLNANNPQDKLHFFEDGQFKLISSRDKHIQSCKSLANLYLSIGHIPLHEYYSKTINYYIRLKEVSYEKLQLAVDGVQQKKTSEPLNSNTNLLLSITPPLSKYGVTHLNDTFSEQDLFSKIAPNLNRIIGLNKKLNFIHTISWKTCDDTYQISLVTDNWQRFVDSSLVDCIYQRYILLLYIISEKRWYFRGEAEQKRIIEGYVDQKVELKPLLNLLNKIPEDTFNSGLGLKNIEAKIITVLKKDLKLDTNSGLGEFIQPQSLEQYKNNCVVESGIIIYSLNNFQDGQRLKKRIVASKNTFVTLISRISQDYYLSLLVSPLIDGKRTIFIIDSNRNKQSYDIVKWLTGVNDDCNYKIVELPCALQRAMSNDSLIHAYFNAHAVQWAINNNAWAFLQEHLSNQEFASAANIEIIKQWFIENTKKPSLSIDDDSPDQDALLQELKVFLNNIITDYLSMFSFKQLEEVTGKFKDDLNEIGDYEDLNRFFVTIINKCPEKVKSGYLNHFNEIFKILKTSKSFEEIIDIVQETIHQSCQDFVEKQEKLAGKFSEFEHVLHGVILSILTANQGAIASTVAAQLNNIYCAIDNSIAKGDYLSRYINFLRELSRLPEIAQNSAITLQLVELKKVIEDNKNEKHIFALLPSTWKNLSGLLQRFSAAEKAIANIKHIFPGLLFHCYELLPFNQIQQEKRTDFYRWINQLDGLFEPIDTCFKTLFSKAKPNIGIEAKLNIREDAQRIKDAFAAFADIVNHNDEKAAQAINMYLRQFMMNRLDEYSKDIARFRTQSTAAIEKFEQNLHHALLESIKKLLKETTKTQPATQLDDYLKTYLKTKTDAAISLNAYQRLVEYLNKDKLLVPQPILAMLNQRLNDKTHSHYSYIVQKMSELAAMISRFAKLEVRLPEFSKSFEALLIERYDHLDEAVACEPKGAIINEIFNRLMPGIALTDIKAIIGGENKQLNEILQKCEDIFQAGDQKASAELSASLRKCMVETTHNYVKSLLTYRQNALLTLNQFERELYNSLAGYDAIQNNQLRIDLTRSLAKLQNNRVDYVQAVELYQAVVKIVQKVCKQAQSNTQQSSTDNLRIHPVFSLALLPRVAAIFEHPRHTLKPHMNERCLNLGKLLDTYVNWCKDVRLVTQHQRSVCTITMDTGCISEVIKRIKQEKADFFAPGNEINIICSNILYTDIDLNTPEYSGVSIAILALYMLNSPHKKSPFEIVTNGQNAPDIWHNKPASDGQGLDSNGNGKPGGHGIDGKHGANAGHVYIVVNNDPKLKVTAIGGNGSNGQNGGNGATGRDGQAGYQPPDKGTLENKYKHEWKGTWISHAYRAIEMGTYGQPGGYGGNAGNAGKGGNGGFQGDVRLVSLDDPSYVIHAESKTGNSGADGDPGKPGSAGETGKDGKDAVVLSHSRSAWSFFTFLFDNRSIDKIVYGLVQESNRQRGGLYPECLNKRVLHGSEAPLPNMVSEAEADRLIKEKAERIKSQRQGNIGRAQSNQPEQQHLFAHINKKKLFNQVTQFFDAYVNPQKRNTFQHWSAQGLSQFLQRLAQLESFPDYKINNLPDVDLDAQKLQLLEEGFANAVESINKQLNEQRIDTSELSIGMTILSEGIEQQFQEMQTEHQDMQAMLQQQIDSIDLSALSIGQSRNNYKNIRAAINQLVKQTTAVAKQTTTTLVDLENKNEPKHKFYKLQFVKHVKKDKWSLFDISAIKTLGILNDFNTQPNEDNLFKIGVFLVDFITKNSATVTAELLNNLESIQNTYFENFKYCDFKNEHLDVLKSQKQNVESFIANQINHEFLSLANQFCVVLSREYTRVYWLMKIEQTLGYLKLPGHNEKQAFQQVKINCINLLQGLRRATDIDLKRYHRQLQEGPYIFKDLPVYAYPGNQGLNQAIEAFNNNYALGFNNILNSLSKYFNSVNMNAYQALLANKVQLQTLVSLIDGLKLNSKLVQLDLNNTQQFKGIKKTLEGFPHSILHDTFQHSTNKKAGNIDITSKIMAFLTSPKEGYIAELFVSIEKNLNNKNFEKSIKDLCNYIIFNYKSFSAETIDSIYQKVLVYPGQTKDQSLSDKLWLIRLLLDCKQAETHNSDIIKAHSKDDVVDDLIEISNNFNQLPLAKIKAKKLSDDESEIILTYIFDLADKKISNNITHYSVDALYKLSLALTKTCSYLKNNSILQGLLEYAEAKMKKKEHEKVKTDLPEKIKTAIEQCTSNEIAIRFNLFKIVKHHLKELMVNLELLLSAAKYNEVNSLIKAYQEFCGKYQSVKAYFTLDNQELNKLYNDNLTTQLKAHLTILNIYQAIKPEVKINFADKLYPGLVKIFSGYFKNDKGIGLVSIQLIEPLVRILNLYIGLPQAKILDSLTKRMVDILPTSRTLDLNVLVMETKVLADIIYEYGHCLPNITLQNIRDRIIDIFNKDLENINKCYQQLLKFIISYNSQKQKSASRLFAIVDGFFHQQASSATANIYAVPERVAEITSLIEKICENKQGPYNEDIEVLDNILATVFNSDQGLALIADPSFLMTVHWLSKIIFSSKDLKFYQTLNIKKKFLSVISKIDTIIDNTKQNNKMADTLHNLKYHIKLASVYQYLNQYLAITDEQKWLDIIFTTEYRYAINLTVLQTKLNSIGSYNDYQRATLIKALIFGNMATVQNEKLAQLKELFKGKTAKFLKECSDALESIDGCINKYPYGEMDNPSIYSLSYALRFNRLIELLIARLRLDRTLLIKDETFIKTLKITASFQDLELAIHQLSCTKQREWVKALLVESTIDKYILLFEDNNNDELDYLRSQLMTISEDLLLLFNNLLVTEYAAQLSQGRYEELEQTQVPIYQKISKTKFSSIISYMYRLKVDNEMLELLADSSLSIWDNQLYEYSFNQRFNRKFTKLAERFEKHAVFEPEQVERCLLFLNRIRTQIGIENAILFRQFFDAIIAKFELMDPQQHQEILRPLKALLQAINDSEITFEEGKALATEYPYYQWQIKLDRIKAALSGANDKDRTIDQLIEVIKNQSIVNNQEQISKQSLTSERLRTIQAQANHFRHIAKSWETIPNGQEKSSVANKLAAITSEKAYKQDPEQYVQENLDRIIPLILYAWYVASNKTQFPKDSQILSLILFVNSQGQSLLQQIKTGEGKTLIVGLISAFKALSGYKVDAVSSNRDLAIEGEHKCRAFFELLGLTSAHNCHDSEENNKLAYQSHIVYGEVGGFQRDILETETKNKDNFADRYKNGAKKCLIVDEVDNMCLDKARHVLYLSHEIESLKWLEAIFINIWIAVLKAEVKNPDDMEKQSADIAKFIANSMHTDDITVPNYLYSYVDNKIKRWVDSAFQARLMKENDQFILNVSKSATGNDKKKTIIPLDKDTGIEQYSTRWSNGLAQFLELKYRRRLSPESLKAVFISNKTFFKRYDNALYGLTGTLGSENSKAFLSEMYTLQSLELPTSKRKRYTQLPSRICSDETDLDELIIKESLETSKLRPVLIICETIEHAARLKEALLSSNAILPQNIHQYILDGDDVEKKFSNKPAAAGDIIIATNKGGRGTDIKVDDGVNKARGLHVILTYMPDNLRIEEQAFGRTARNGNPGTGQFILNIDLKRYLNEYKLIGLAKEKLQARLDILADLIIEKEKKDRDAKEAARLSQLKQKDILHLDIEQELFQNFEQYKASKRGLFSKIAACLQQDPNVKVLTSFEAKVVEAFENILKDRWAFWLDSVKEVIDTAENATHRFAILNKFKHEYIAQQEAQLTQTNIDHMLTQFIKTPEEAIQIGRVFLNYKASESETDNTDKGRLQIATKYFERAAQLGDITGYAYITLAFCIINQQKNSKTARHYLKSAINTLEAMKRSQMANLKVVELLPQMASNDIQKKVSQKENLYYEQIAGRLEMIGLHLHYLRTAAGENVESCDFLEEGKTSDEDIVKSKNIYDLLVNKQVIYGDRIRKPYRDDPAKMRPILIAKLDPSIADGVYELLNSKINTEISKADFEQLVCSRDELWEALGLNKYSEKVYILDKKALEKALEARFELVWKSDLEAQITDPENVQMNLFEASQEKRELKKFLEDKELLFESKRVALDHVKPEEMNTSGPYQKYTKVIFNQNGNEKNNLAQFLIQLKKSIRDTHASANSGPYLYHHQLPYGTKEEEAAKLYMFLKEQYILKSGGVYDTKYKREFVNFADELNDILDKSLKDLPFKDSKEFIKRKLSNMQGDLRKSKDVTACFKRFEELDGLESYPTEMRFFEGLGLGQFLIIKEDKSWWNWGAFAVFVIGIVQVVAGALLCCVGLGNIGNALISEGINDMIYATMAIISGRFSWKDWLTQKAISFSISMATAGIQTLANLGKTVAKLGSVSTMVIIAKVLVKKVIDFAVNTLTNLLSEKVIESIKKGVIDKVISGTLNNLLEGVRTFIKAELEKLNQRLGFANLETAYNNIKENIKSLFLSSKNIIQQFENIKSNIATTVEDSLKSTFNSLKNSDSTIVRVAATVIDVASIISTTWNIVDSVIKGIKAAEGIVKSLHECFQGLKNLQFKACKADESEIMNSINQKVAELIEIIKEFINDNLLKLLEKLLVKAVNGTLGKICTSIAQSSRDFVDNTFKNSNPLQEARLNQYVTDAIRNQPSSKDEQLARAKNELLRTSVHSLKELTKNVASDLNITPLVNTANNVRSEISKFNDKIHSTINSIDISGIKKTYNQIKIDVDSVHETYPKMSNTVKQQLDKANVIISEKIENIEDISKKYTKQFQKAIDDKYDTLIKDIGNALDMYASLGAKVQSSLSSLGIYDLLKDLIEAKTSAENFVKAININSLTDDFDKAHDRFDLLKGYHNQLEALDYTETFSQFINIIKSYAIQFKPHIDTFRQSIIALQVQIIDKNSYKRFQNFYNECFNPIDITNVVISEPLITMSRGLEAELNKLRDYSGSVISIEKLLPEYKHQQAKFNNYLENARLLNQRLLSLKTRLELTAKTTANPELKNVVVNVSRQLAGLGAIDNDKTLTTILANTKLESSKLQNWYSKTSMGNIAEEIANLSAVAQSVLDRINAVNDRIRAVKNISCEKLKNITNKVVSGRDFNLQIRNVANIDNAIESILKIFEEKTNTTNQLKSKELITNKLSNGLESIANCKGRLAENLKSEKIEYYFDKLQKNMDDIKDVYQLITKEGAAKLQERCGHIKNKSIQLKSSIKLGVKPDQSEVEKISADIETELQQLKNSSEALTNTKMDIMKIELKNTCEELTSIFKPETAKAITALQKDFSQIGNNYKDLYKDIRANFNNHLNQLKTGDNQLFYQKELTRFQQIVNGFLNEVQTLQESANSIAADISDHLLKASHAVEELFHQLANSASTFNYSSRYSLAIIDNAVNDAEREIEEIMTDLKTVYSVTTEAVINTSQKMAVKAQGFLSSNEIELLKVDAELRSEIESLAQLDLAGLGNFDFISVKVARAAIAQQLQTSVKAFQSMAVVLKRNTIKQYGQEFNVELSKIKDHFFKIADQHQLAVWSSQLAQYQLQLEQFINQCSSLNTLFDFSIIETIHQQLLADNNKLELLAQKYLKETEIKELSKGYTKLFKQLDRQYKDLAKKLTTKLESVQASMGNIFETLSNNDNLKDYISQTTHFDAIAHQKIKEFSSYCQARVQELKAQVENEFTEIQKQAGKIDQFFADVSKGVTADNIEKLGMTIHKPAKKLAKKLTEMDSFISKPFSANDFKHTFWQQVSKQLADNDVTKDLTEGLKVDFSS